MLQFCEKTRLNGVPLMVVAKNLGHTDTRMVEKHYGHLAPGYVADAKVRHQAGEDEREGIALKLSSIVPILPIRRHLLSSRISRRDSSVQFLQFGFEKMVGDQRLDCLARIATASRNGLVRCGLQLVSVRLLWVG